MRALDLFIRTSERIPDSLLGLTARLAAAMPFWRSGQSKLEGSELVGIKWNIFAVKESKTYLFQHEFGFPEAIAPAATHLAALGENLLPIALALGIASRFGAAGLIIMTLVIQFYVFPGELLRMNGNWSVHLLWFAPLLYVLARGPGDWSVDALLKNRYQRNENFLGKAH
jgi:putative oxidoreductase